MTTGTPVRSSPVRLAMRVIPKALLCAMTRAIVSSGVKRRSPGLSMVVSVSGDFIPRCPGPPAGRAYDRQTVAQ